MPDKQKQPFTLCFRVETPSGLGMYNTELRPFLMCGEDHYYTRPGPEVDGLQRPEDMRAYYFGFPTMDAFKRWMGDIFIRPDFYDDFHDMRVGGKHAKKALTDAGLMISVYLTDDYSKTERQMCFRLATAHLVARMPVLTPNMETQSCHSASHKSPSRQRTMKANPSRLSTNLLSWNLPPRSAVSRRLRPQAVGLIPRAN